MKIFKLVLISIILPYLSTAQNVGIGTDSPEMPLHVEGGIGTGLRITRAGTDVNLDLKAKKHFIPNNKKSQPDHSDWLLYL